MKIPLLGLVENMSYFKCSNCSTPQYIFGKGHVKQIQKDYNIDNILKVPLTQSIAEACNQERPSILDEPNKESIDDYNTFTLQLLKGLQ